MERDLTQGKIGKSILLFSISMILGNLLQQFYNIVDTYIVGKYIGSNDLVGNCYWMDFSGYNWYCIWYKNRKMVQVKNTAFAVFFISYFD